MREDERFLLKPTILVPMDDGVQVRTPDQALVLRGAAARTAWQLWRRLRGPFSLTETVLGEAEREVLAALSERGLLIPVPAAHPLQQWEADHPKGASGKTVLLVGEGALSRAVRRRLEAAEVEVIVKPQEVTGGLQASGHPLLIAVSDVPTRRPWADAARVAERLGVPCLIAEQFGYAGTVAGPLGMAGCFGCYEQRRLEASQRPQALAAYWESLDHSPPDPAALWPYHDECAERLAALVAQRSLAGCDVPARVLHVDLRTGESREETLLPMPGCPRCREGAAAAFGKAGPPGLVNATLGPVQSLVPMALSAGEPAIEIWTARPAGVTSGSPRVAPAGGAGATAHEARMRALGEAAERYCGVRGGVQVTARPAELDEPFIEPDLLLPYTPDQYRTEGFPYEPYDGRSELAWMEGRSLLTAQPVWVPAFAVRLDPAHARYCRPSSTGLAAGRTWTEAVLAGLCEVFEREACMLTWLLGSGGPLLQFAPGGDAELDAMCQRCRESGLEVRFLALDTGIALPCVLTVLESAAGRRGVWVTLGCAADPQWVVAARKALRESILKRHTLINLQPWDTARSIERLIDHAVAYQDPAMLPALAKLQNEEQVAAHDLPRRSGTPQELLAYYVERCAAVGLEPVAVNLSTPDILMAGYHVARVVVPGSVPMTAGQTAPPLGARRLRQRAEALGLKIPQELNLLPHPFT